MEAIGTRTKKPPAKTTPPKTVDDYIAAAPKEKRATLTKLRETVKAAAPKATEAISYGIVGYKHNGKYVAYFGHWKAHFAMYGWSDRLIETHAPGLRAYGTGKGTFQFPADKPPPYGLVTKIVRARMAEIDKAG